MPPRSDNGAGQRVAELAGLCESILTIEELRACGLTRSGVRTRVRHGTLHRIHEGIYAVGHANLSPLARCVAAVKACGDDAFLGFSSALATMNLGSWEEGLPPEVVLLGSAPVARPGIRVHRTIEMPPEDLRELGCIQVTSPARTISDVAARLDDDATLALVRAAQGKRLVNHTQLLNVHARLGPRPGSARLARGIARGPEPTRSVLESTVLDLMLGAGFALPDVNVPLWIEGRHVVPDFRWPEARLVVEADGAAWHSGAAAHEADAQRQAALEAAGERVMRITWHEAVADRARTIRRLERGGAPYAASLSAQGR